MNRIILIAVCLQAVIPASAASLFGGPREPGQMPSRFVRFEGLADGPCFVNGPPLLMGRLAGVTVMLNRVRFGVSLDEGYAEFDGWSGDMMLPLHVGYTLLSRPKKTLFFYGAVPEIYAEASGSLWGPMLAFEFEPALRVALCCDVDYCGLGARIELGGVDIQTDYYGRKSRMAFIYAGLQMRLLTFGIGF